MKASIPSAKRIRNFFLPPHVRYSHLFQLVNQGFSYSPRERIIKTAMKYLSYSGLKGDYLEFGVYDGYTFTAAYHFSQTSGLDSMRFYAFDSFKGLPELGGVDCGAQAEFTCGQYSCGLEEFKKNIFNNRVKSSKVKVVPGWFSETLTKETKKKLPINKAALIWVDCDLYESAVPVLDFVTDYVQDGTLIFFDDWFCFRGNPERGEQRAFREWLERTPSITATEFRKFDWSGNSFILHLKQGE